MTKLADMTPEERAERFASLLDQIRERGRDPLVELGASFAALRDADREAERKANRVRLSMADARIEKLKAERDGGGGGP